MASITIKDLTENIDLDRQAMTAITGGARSGGRPPLPAAGNRHTTRIVDYPTGVSRRPLTADSILFK
jgi:hypothetical protein